MVSELLGCQPLVGSMATKERVTSALTQAECVHFATHVSWKLSALVLTPNTEGNPASSKSSFGHPYTIPESLRVQDDASDVESISDCPPLRELLLTAADLLDLRLSVKLVVLSSSQEANGRVTADGLVALTRAFLAAGAQCVLVALWPVPVAASKMFVHAFYSSLLNGLKASASLGEAMKAVQSSKAFSHPSNWAGREPNLPVGVGGPHSLALQLWEGGEQALGAKALILLSPWGQSHRLPVHPQRNPQLSASVDSVCLSLGTQFKTPC